MALDSMQEIFDKIQAGRKPFWQVVRDTDVEERQVTAEASFEKMHATWRAMVESVDTYRADRRSVSGLVGGDAQKMWDYAAEQETLCGPYLQEVIATALCVAESNACMHRIVAAPTAGACGVLPAVLVPLYRRGTVDEEAIVRALYVAAGIGAVVGVLHGKLVLYTAHTFFVAKSPNFYIIRCCRCIIGCAGTSSNSHHCHNR